MSSHASRPIALITGASSGIGRAVAQVLSPTHQLLIGGRDAGRVGEVVAECASAEPFVVDLNDENAMRAAVAGIQRLDLLIHSAGVIAYGPVHDATAREWRDVLGTNLIAPALLTAAALPALRTAGGTIVFVNSGAGLHAHPNWSVYAGSKHGLTALADALRGEEPELRVVSVHPGRAATPMQVELNQREGQAYRPERYLSPSAVAEAVLIALATPGQDSISINP